MKKTPFILLTSLPWALLLFGCDQAPDTGLAQKDKPALPLNDTGMDWCANLHERFLDCPIADHPGQDAETGRDALAKQGKLKKTGAGHGGFDFTKLDQEGEPLPADAKQWVCVRDNVTGLEWEIKTTDGGLRHHAHTYTWHNPDETRNGGDPGVQNGGQCKESACDTQAYVTAINQRGLCGHNDWRMPDVLELNSIVDYSREAPSIDADYFPDIPPPLDDEDEHWVRFWSATPKAQHAEDALFIEFRQGNLFMAHKGETRVHLRLVRGRPFGWQAEANTAP